MAAHHRAGRQVDDRQVHADAAHDGGGRGLVAAAHQHRPVDRMAAQQLLGLHGEEVAVEHGRRLDEILRERHGRQFEREAAGLPDAALHVLDAGAEMDVARIDVAPRVDDGDDRLAHEIGQRVAHLQGARAVAERAQVRHAEPAVAAQLLGCFPSRHRSSRSPAPSNMRRRAFSICASMAARAPSGSRCLDRLQDGAVLVLDRAQPFRRAQQRQVARQGHAEGDMRLQGRLHQDLIRVVRGLGDGPVEALVGVDAELARLDAGFELAKCRLDLCQVVLLPARGGQGGGGAFEPHPELEAALDVGDRADRHELQHRLIRAALDIAAGALARHDQPVVAKARQRLAHNRTRGAEAARQLRLGGQARVHRELAADDALEELLVDAGAELRLEIGGRLARRPIQAHGRLLQRRLSLRQRANSSLRLGGRRIEAEDRCALLRPSPARSPRTRSARRPPRRPRRRCACGMTTTPSPSPTMMSPG